MSDYVPGQSAWQYQAEQEVKEERAMEQAAELGAHDARSNLAPDPDRHDLRGLERTEYNIAFHQEVKFRTQMEIANARRRLQRPGRYQVVHYNSMMCPLNPDEPRIKHLDMARDRMTELLEHQDTVPGDQIHLYDWRTGCQLVEAVTKEVEARD